MSYFNRGASNAFGGEDRTWSDDQGYIETVAGLINKAHEASIDGGQDVYDWFFILEQLQLEIIGQMVVRDLKTEIEELSVLRAKTSHLIDKAYSVIGSKVGNLPLHEASKLRRIVFPYHEKLNILIHQMDLRLHEVKPTVRKLAVEDDY